MRHGLIDGSVGTYAPTAISPCIMRGAATAGRIYHGVSDCHWFKELNATPNSGEVKP